MKIRFLLVFCLMSFILKETTSKRAFTELTSTKNKRRKRVKGGAELAQKNKIELSNDIYDQGKQICFIKVRESEFLIMILYLSSWIEKVLIN